MIQLHINMEGTLKFKIPLNLLYYVVSLIINTSEMSGSDFFMSAHFS